MTHLDPVHNCGIHFSFVSAIISPDDDIESVVNLGRDVFVGTKNGTLLKYQIRKHVHRNGSISFTSKIHYQKVLNLRKAILQLCIVRDLRLLIVLSGGVVSIHKLKDLALINIVPCRGVVHSFCCNDGIPYYGLAINTGKMIFLFDLNQGFKSYKALNLVDIPKCMTWIRKSICIANKKSYTLLSANKPPQLMAPVNSNPLIVVLPSDEFALSIGRKVLFSTTNITPARSPVEFSAPSTKLAFCFPFIISLSDDFLEIKNIMDPVFHLVLKKPTSNNIKLLSCDGKDILVSEGKAIYALVPDNNSYWTWDHTMLNLVRKRPKDKFMFMRYLKFTLSNPQGPYYVFISDLAESLAVTYSNPEESSLEEVKKIIGKHIRRIFNIVYSYFQHVEIVCLRQLIYSVVQTAFYSKIYWLLFAMITCRYKSQDYDYYGEIKAGENKQPGDLGVPKQFWLMQASLSEPPPSRGSKLNKAKTTTNTTNDSPTCSTDAKRAPESGLTPTPTPTKPEVKASPISSPQTQKARDSLDALKEPTPPKQTPPPNKPTEPATSHVLDDDEMDADYAAFVMMDDETLALQQSNLTSKSRKGKPDGIAPIANATKTRAAVADRLRDVLLKDNNQNGGFQIPVTFSELSDPLSRLCKVLLEGELILNDVTDELSVSFLSNEPPFLISPSVQFNFFPLPPTAGLTSTLVTGSESDKNEFDAQHLIVFCQNGKHYQISFFEESGVDEIFSKLMKWSSFQEGANNSDAQREKRDSKGREEDETMSSEEIQETGEEAELLIGDLEWLSMMSNNLDDEISTKPEKENDLLPKVNSNDAAANGATDSPADEDDISLTFDYEPYRRPIQTLRKIQLLKSPRDKLACILQTFMDIIQCVTDFWDQYNREPVVSADDLVPIFSFVILKAKVPKLYSEMSFLWEFATDTEMKGKFGYGFATFQIGVEVVAKLSTLDLKAGATKNKRESIQEEADSKSDLMSEIEQNYTANHLRKIHLTSDKIEVKRASVQSQRLEDSAGFSLTSDYDAVYQSEGGGALMDTHNTASSPSGMLSGDDTPSTSPGHAAGFLLSSSPEVERKSNFSIFSQPFK